tara:strand:- start:96 stop:224 length:129 start_codon:yes stop_codon:yes gene_type:complete
MVWVGKLGAASIAGVGVASMAVMLLYLLGEYLKLTSRCSAGS